MTTDDLTALADRQGALIGAARKLAPHYPYVAVALKDLERADASDAAWRSRFVTLAEAVGRSADAIAAETRIYASEGRL